MGKQAREPVVPTLSLPLLQLGPQKSLALISCLASDQFLLIKEAKNRGQEHILWHPMWGLSPSGERVWAPLEPLNAASCGWQAGTCIPCWHHHVWWVCLLAPGGLSTLIQATLFPFPPVLYLSPFSLSLSWNLSTSLCPLLLLSYPSESVDIGQLQYHFSQLMRPASFGLQMACLDGSQAEVRDVCFTPCRPRSSGLSWLETYESDRSLNLISCSGWKSNCSDILTFIFLPPRKAALGTG